MISACTMSCAAVVRLLMLTMNVEMDHHCAEAIFVLGLAQVVPRHTSLSDHQGTHRLEQE